MGRSQERLMNSPVKCAQTKGVDELMRKQRLRLVNASETDSPVVDLRESMDEQDSQAGHTTIDVSQSRGTSTKVVNNSLTDEVSPTANPERGSIEDLRVLYDLHGAEIFRFCNRLLGDVGTAEEAVQETFLRAWRSASTWDPSIAAKRTWMYAIARNACIDLLRAQSRRIPIDRARSTSSSGQSPADQLASPELGSDDPAFESVMANWMLEEALRRIGPDHREAIVRTYVHDRSYPEVAAELGIPETTLRTRVFYGLRALRKVLDEMGWHE
jgi:RNA polymerase sigma-70 factor, ECF subfamily